MSQSRNNEKNRATGSNAARKTAGRGHLKLIAGGEESNDGPTEEEAKSPGRQNPFVQFMESYADSLDAEIQKIMRL